MKNSGVEWIGEIPEDWEVYRNKNAFICNKEIVGKNSNSTQLLSLTTGGIKCKDINNAEGKLPESFDTYQYVKKNDVVMCLFDLDMSAVFSGISQYDGMISPAYKVLSCQDRANPLFVHYWFSYIFDGRKFNHYAKNIRYTLNYDEFATLPILLPPKETQQRIASYLDKKCSKIEETIQNQQQVIEKLKAYKQSLITEAVTGKVKIENGKVCGEYESYKDSGVEWIGKIPSGWILSKFKFISKEIGDGLHGTPTFDESGDIYFLNGTNIGKEKLLFKDDTDRINSLEYEKYKHPLLSKYTIFIALNGATYGKTSFYNNEKVLLGKSAGYITFDKKQNILFLRYYLQSYAAKKIEEISLLGSTIQNLSLYTLNNFSVPLPSEIEQNSIVEYLYKKCTAIDTAIEQKQSLIEKLTEYKKSLIYECVTGKKEVN